MVTIEDLEPSVVQPNAQVTAKQTLTADLFRIWLRPDRPFEGFQAGQFVTVGLPGRTTDEPPVRRPYSLASGEHESDLELYVRLVDNGALTPRLMALEPGDRVWVDERYFGNFTLNAALARGAKEFVFLATGTGLAPFIAMLRTEAVKARCASIVVVHGARLPEELSYSEELRLLEARSKTPRVVYLPTCTRPSAQSRWDGLVGRIPDLFASGALQARIGALDPERHHIFLCGNPEMIVAMETWLAGNGHKRHRKREAGNVHSERYW